MICFPKSAIGQTVGAHIQDQDTVKRTVMGMVSQTQPAQTRLEILVSSNPQTNVMLHFQMEIVTEKRMVKGFFIIQHKFSTHKIDYKDTY